MTSQPPSTGQTPSAGQQALAEAEIDYTAVARPMPRALKLAIFAAAILAAIWHVYANTIGLVSELLRNVGHYVTFGVLAALLLPMLRPLSRDGPPRGRDRLVLLVDAGLALLTIFVSVYILVRERDLSGRSFTSWLDFAVMIAAILLILEYARRATGITIPILIAVILGYIFWWGQFIPGALGFSGLSIETILQRSIYGEDGMFGTIATISATYVFMFILFGAFLVRSGAGEFIIQFSRAIAGRITGGPGFVAVISSGLTGTISGSAMANTVQTGVITIPLMKRSGFPPKFAAGVEASASTGGQLMPPIMGAGAFVMANLTEIPYFDIVAVSVLPALMFFGGIAFNVRIVAKKYRLTALDDETPRLREVLKLGALPFALPIAVLIGLLIAGFTPVYAAGYAILSVIVSSWLTPNRMGPTAIAEAIIFGMKNMILTAVLLLGVGLIVMVLTTTGLGNTFSQLITQWAGGSLIIAIVLVAVASLLLGMGLPVTAAYIVLATLSAPALRDLIVNGQVLDALTVQEVPQSLATVFMLFNAETLVPLAQSYGISLQPDLAVDLVAAIQAGGPLTAEQAAAAVELMRIPDIAMVASNVPEELLSPAAVLTALLSAHMIIFWLSQDSNVTPPVCLTAFAAAGIAGTHPMATGVTAWRISKVLYIVPLLFAYTPLLAGDVSVALKIFAFGMLGIYALVAAIEGHAEAPISWPLRLVLAAIGVALLWPSSVWINLAGSAFLVAFMALNIMSDRRLAARPAAG